MFSKVLILALIHGLRGVNLTKLFSHYGAGLLLIVSFYLHISNEVWREPARLKIEDS